MKTAAEIFLKASPKKQIITRILRNLIGSTEDDESRLAYAETILAIDPDNLEFRAYRIDLRIRTGRTEEALEDMDWMLQKHPEGLDVERVRQMRRQLEQSLEQSRTDKAK